MWHPMALYMMEEWEIRNNQHYLPESVIDEALRNSVEIGEKCNAELPAIKRHLPVFIPAHSPYVKEEHKQDSAAKLFIDLVEAGIIYRYGEDAPAEIWERAEKEMEVFLTAEIGIPGGLSHYFLQAWDFCQFCDDEGIIRGPGRGSAAGSLVSYALGITDVDPLRYKLSFERFYNPGRAKGFPDIDTDFPVAARQKIKDYLASRWGHDNVRSIGTVTRMKPKAALDRTCNAMGVTWDEKEAIKKIVSTVPDLEILTSSSIGWKDDGSGKSIYVWDHVEKEITRYINAQTQDRQDVLNRWMEFLAVVTSRVGGYGVHASGVVVSDGPLDAELPSMWSSNQKCQATMFPMSDVEIRQFVKQDVLGLRTLDTLQDWHDQMESKGVNVKWSGLEAKEHPIEMWEMIDKGLTTGIFQIEEKQAARKLAMGLQPRSVEDLGLIVALNRPGPLRSGAPESFIVRRNGGSDDKFDGREVEQLADILDETYGWFVYQEQVINLFSKMGYSESDADAVRKILGKKLPEEMNALYEGRGEWEGKGYKQVAPEFFNSTAMTVLVWDILQDFALYSFNKSHSIAYGTIAFRTLYAKYYAPAEFIMACVRTNSDEAGQYVAEGRRMGISVNAPDIKKSDVEISVVDDEIYFGFSNVKGIGKTTAKYIKKLTEAYDIGTPTELVAALAEEAKDWTAAKERHKESDNPAPFKKKSPNQECRVNVIEALNCVGAFDSYSGRSTPMPMIQKYEKELLGIILTDNTVEAFQKNQDLIDACDEYEGFLSSQSDIRARLPGIITQVRKTKTKAQGKEMGIVKIEMGEDTVEFAVFPQQWISYKHLWQERTPGVFLLRKTDRGINFEEGMKLA
jgi:DNA polymerase-3 subunit alpha